MCIYIFIYIYINTYICIYIQTSAVDLSVLRRRSLGGGAYIAELIKR